MERANLRRGLLVGVVAVALLAGACGGGRSSDGASPGTTGPATRRITNVGDAVNASDAVTKSQLDSVAATADAVTFAPLRFAAAVKQWSARGSATVSA